MKRFKFLIFAVIISLFFVNFGFAAETDSDEKINLRKTEEERKTEFDNALSEISHEVTKLEQEAFKDGLGKSKNNFLRLYRSQWKTLNMAEKLEKAVEIAFDESTKDLMWGTTGIQIAANRDNIITKIQEAVAFKFQEDFDNFLSNLELDWGETLQKDVADFYHRTRTFILASDENPMLQAYIRGSTYAQDKGLNVMERVKTSIQEQYPELSASGTKIAGGLLAVVLRRQIQKVIVNQLRKTALRKVLGSSLSKVAGFAVPALGWAMAAWGAADIAITAWSVPGDVKNMLQERNKALYYNEIPEIYWDAMEPYVMDTFVFSYEKLQRSKDEADILAKNPTINELAKDLNEDEKTHFIERISALSRILGRTGYDDLLADFGELIRDSSQRDFETLASMLQQGSKLQIKEWLNVAGSKYFDLYRAFNFNKETWEIFPPNKESFEALTWMVKLPPKARNVAVQLSINDIKWIMNEMPERYISQLFSSSTAGGDDPDKIHLEIRRLSSLPDIETRKPWQSFFNYYWNLYGFYFEIFIVFLFAVLILRIILSLRNSAKKSKDSSAPQGTVINLNISPNNMPQIQNATPTKKYKVKAKISPKIANELKTTTWDISQQILPSDDDSENRIFSVELENLDKIAAWISKNKNDIEVLEPEELKSSVPLHP